MKLTVASWLLCSVVGTILVALPDDGRRVVWLSEAHGPSTLDAVGVLVLIAGWGMLLREIVARRDRLAVHRGTAAYRAAVFVAGAGSGLLVASVFSDFALWWAVGAVLLALVQVVALAAVAGLRRERGVPGRS